MKPRELLAETRTPDGGRLALYAHDGHFEFLHNNRELMNSYVTHSEVEMGERVGASIARIPTPLCLIGGLGLGFTLDALLTGLPSGGRIEVSELLAEVIAWNRKFLYSLNGRLLDDPRVTVRTEDVVTRLEMAPENAYDAIILDIDNGPVPMVQSGNARLYTLPFLCHLRTRLRPDGIVAFWSAAPDRAFAGLLRKAGFQVEGLPTKAYRSARRAAYMVYYARHQESQA